MVDKDLENRFDGVLAGETYHFEFFSKYLRLFSRTNEITVRAIREAVLLYGPLVAVSIYDDNPNVAFEPFKDYMDYATDIERSEIFQDHQPIGE